MEWWYAEQASIFINLAKITSVKLTEDGALVLMSRDGFPFLETGGDVQTDDCLILYAEDASDLDDYLRSIAPLRQRERWQREREAQS
ncbi:MAG: hypothetical protein ACTHMU_09685 [Thermomicrobiales bacterium]